MSSHTGLNKHLTCSDDLVDNRKLASFKTKMCTEWEITGQCPFGWRCHFAHGHSELQVPGSQIKAETLPAIAEATHERTTDEVLPKWKIPKKITNIYADWLEDLVPPEKLLR
ncbi:zinc finger CCCH domain-containing protein 39-like [Apium graveolens]|uniref:zinc finger CCCH domain-containing protein 39-like n=1 Tax=Apium graveolens TaxID=4045 RepID=UPI003D7BD42C